MTAGRPIVARAVAFIFFVCLSVIGIEAWSLWRAHSIQLKETEVATSNMARALAQQAQDSIKSADTILVGTVERIETDGLSPPASDRLHRLFKTRVAELPMLHGLFVYDAEGDWIVNSHVPLGTRGNNADRPYFIFHRNNAGRGPHVGGPLRSRTNGEWMIPVSRRINHPDGTFAGVALATIKMSHFRTFYERFSIGESGAISLALTDGTLLVRRPFNESLIGTNISFGAVFEQYRLKGPVGTAMLVARLDNVERLVSYRRLDDYPILVAAALSKKEILAEWWKETYWIFSAVAVVVFALGMLGLRLIRQLKAQEKLESDLRAAKSTLELANKSLEMLALQDGLTGLANRRRFDLALESEFNRLARSGKPLAVIMIDVDYFKRYNDMYGHPAGDECLMRIGAAISSIQYRPGDLAARYGGEEIVLLLPETDVAGALVVAAKIRLAVTDMAIAHAGNTAGIVTISLGVAATVPDRNKATPLQLLKAADSALYTAKSEGRNRVCSSDAMVEN